MIVASTNLRRAPSCAAAARAFMVSTLGDWGCPGGSGWEELELLTSEVVTNAFRHTEGPIYLSVMRSDASSATVRVEVVDCDPALPVVVEVGSDGDHGRGMRLVDVLSQRWGADRRVDGKVVWFEVALR